MSNAFSRPAVIIIIALGLLTVALSALLPSCDTGPDSGGLRSDPDSHSISAIGHAGFYDLLRRLGRPVGRSDGRGLAQAGENGLLILAEPGQAFLEKSLDEQELLAAPRLLLVLPKWRGQPDRERSGWVSELYLRPESSILAILALVDEDGEIVRQSWPAQWTVNQIGLQPSGLLAELAGEGSAFQVIDPARRSKLNTIQLMRSELMEPLVARGDEILLGQLEIEGRIIWVLSDPDLMSNQGLVRGDNAQFMVSLVDRLRSVRGGDPGGPIIFDESVHGYSSPDGQPTALIFRFPFIVVTILAAAAALLTLLAGSARFGAPLQPPAALDFGKSGLIGNGARLLDRAGHQGIMLRRYVWMNAVAVARNLHAPAGLNNRGLAEWLDQIGRARGVSRRCADILNQVPSPLEETAADQQNLPRLFQCAQDIFHWRQEIEGLTVVAKPDGPGK